MRAIILADSHTHLDQFSPEEIPRILESAKEVGVAMMIAAGVSEESSARCIDLAEQYPEVYAGVGFHPDQIKCEMDDDAYKRMRSLALSSSKVVCISEVGLDFLEGMPDIDTQQQVFRQAIRLAKELDLPVIFHSRELPGRPSDHFETLRVLSEERVWEVGGVMHYFQSGEEVAKRCLDMRLTLSVGKPLLRLLDLQEVIKSVPLESLVLETDSYPQPFKRNRARWTEPKDVRLVAEKVAELKGVSVSEVAEVTTSNLLGLLKRNTS
ncbi:MAG: TatD family hydrolase [Chloroflexota bacterium]